MLICDFRLYNKINLIWLRHIHLHTHFARLRKAIGHCAVNINLCYLGLKPLNE